jgi:6-phosphofructokinase
MKPIRTIGTVNGGGDAPGLNAVTRAIVRGKRFSLVVVAEGVKMPKTDPRGKSYRL